ncbi:MAG: undecaprenyldiphospho-muramoylpentapeptide beta-N-acetylglucosaminyltransferase [Bacteroidetes bacterium]|nr:undecaprenyldiphospho-muramoylpentapeptide beta-N-acetylglucosaminyltransferase [Bacteroidota bacterium]
MRANPKIIISGGGTGGHIFPAIAIAKALMKRLGAAEILFVGAKGRMEMERVPLAGFKIEGLWISGLQRSLTINNLLFPIKLIFSLFKAQQIIKRFKPDIVIGVGGYASGPTLRMAIRQKIPTLIQEQNSYPGITNRLLAKEVNSICVAYDHMDHFFPKEKIVKTGNPVREELIDVSGKRKQAREFFKLDSRQVVFVVGGSQGAIAINKSIENLLPEFIKNDLQLIWQTGTTFYNKALQNASDRIKIFKFIEKMDLAYAAADIVISRAGAIAISELCLVKNPVIFIPLPSAAEDHQTKNAVALVELEAALMIKESNIGEKLGPILKDLSGNKELQLKLKANIGKLAIPNASEIIVDEIMKLLGKKN